jgi:regulator of sirC expression with transglutaminase-like and TPR domain
VKSLPEHRKRFTRLVEEGLDESSLAHAALLLACEARPSLDVEAYLGCLGDLSMRFRARQADRGPGLRGRIEALNEVLFEEYGLHGNVDDYYDPRNSLLDCVLDRKTGIPITLSIVFMAVGRSGGLDVVGVGMPGHFLVSVRGEGRGVYVDPFHRGQILSVDDCRRRHRVVAGEGHTWDDAYLEATPPRDIIVRVLNNLKRTYLQATDFRQALWVQDLLVELRGDDVVQYRDRGLIHAQLKRYGDARHDLRTYLERWPGRAPDADQIEQDLERLQRLHQMLN